MNRHSRSTLQQHHAIVYSALKAALKADMIPRNVADLVMSKPRARADHDDVPQHCWEAEEATKFLRVAKEAGAQAAAFYSLALDTGARKAELCGLRWSEADLEQGKVTIVRQLVKPGPDPIFGPPKNGRRRTIDVPPGTVTWLRKYKRAQAELKLSLGTAYHDHGLLCAKDNGPGFGHPLQMNNLGQREYARLIKLAGVRRIKFHGLRHTCATHLLKNGVPAQVVSERLGASRRRDHPGNLCPRAAVHAGGRRDETRSDFSRIGG
jgi:integrase